MTKPTLTYDGNCGFCRRSVAWFKARDLAANLEYLPRQSAERAERFPQLDDVKYQGAMQLVMPSGEIRSGAMATATALQQITGTHWHLLGRFIALPGIRFCAHLGYKVIAKNRHRFACADGRCK